MSKTDIPDRLKHLSNKLTYPYEYFKSPIDYQKSVSNIKKRSFLK